MHDVGPVVAACHVLDVDAVGKLCDAISVYGQLQYTIIICWGIFVGILVLEIVKKLAPQFFTV